MVKPKDPVEDEDLATETLELEASKPAQGIVLPSGKIATEIPLSGADFWEFLAIATKEANAANEWLLLNAFAVDGEALTVGILEDELSFEDVAALNAEAKVFSPDPSGAIALPDGRIIERRTLPGRKFFEFQRRAAGEGMVAATRWVITQMFYLDGLPVSQEQLTLAEPEGFGFRVVAHINQVVSALFRQAPAPKK